VGVVRQRALVHVGGPPAAGKTTFVETVLAYAGQSVMIAARCRRDDALTKARESHPKTDLELGRYRSAGAVAVARYDFPGADDAHDSFFMTGLMENYSDAVMLEGDRPLVFADLMVYVVPASGGRLLVRRKANPAQNLGAAGVRPRAPAICLGGMPWSRSRRTCESNSALSMGGHRIGHVAVARCADTGYRRRRG